ncbi:MAG TPA: nucleoside hydrolase [Ktedonobacteraceae bacterium]|nr:nucleoside hydrolase [Ktedonobacteraceae bacterium]
MESPIVKQRIILDTDPGIDDALALFLALASPEVQLEAVTTVSGNVPIEHTTRNALTLLELAGRADIPVARGCPCPLVVPPVLAADVHGENGLGNVILPEPQRQPVGQHAIELLIERIMAAPGEIALICVGPLTNVAQAVRREPRLAQTVRELVIMGGALRVPGNITPCAEFNIFADPHAAHIVLHAGWPVRLVALDVTTRTLFKRELAEQLAASGSPVTVLIKRMMDYYCDIFGQARRLDAIQMHDPLCLAAAFRPDLLTWEEAYVDVELAGSLTLGETVGFFAGSGKLLPHSPNVLASVDVDRESFIDLYVERIRATFA